MKDIYYPPLAYREKAVAFLTKVQQNLPMHMKDSELVCLAYTKKPQHL